MDRRARALVMRRRAGIAALAVVMLLLVASGSAGAAAHPIHSTLADIAYDHRARTLSIRIRIFADDFATAVARRTGVVPEADHAVPAQAALLYVREMFVVRDGARAIPLASCGISRTGDVVWVCLTGAVPRGVGRAMLDDRLLHDVHGDQINLVRLTVNGEQRSMLFTRGDGPRRLTP